MYTRRGLIAACFALLLIVGTVIILLPGLDATPLVRPLATLGASLAILTCLYILVDFTLAGWLARREAEARAATRTRRER